MDTLDKIDKVVRKQRSQQITQINSMSQSFLRQQALEQARQTQEHVNFSTAAATAATVFDEDFVSAADDGNVAWENADGTLATPSTASSTTIVSSLQDEILVYV